MFLIFPRLSITEWRPVTGSLLPLSAADWDSEFSKYRASPEFKLLNPHMTLEEFKKIYYMEWGHRLWGRFVGLSFVIPAVYFVARRKVAAHMSLRLLGISGLIAFQGVLGWYMVKSGLKDDLFAPGSHPRVSQYRLTAHLGAAFCLLYRHVMEWTCDPASKHSSIAPHTRIGTTATSFWSYSVFLPKISGRTGNSCLHNCNVWRFGSWVGCRINLQRIPTHGNRTSSPSVRAF